MVGYLYSLMVLKAAYTTFVLHITRLWQWKHFTIGKVRLAAAQNFNECTRLF